MCVSPACMYVHHIHAWRRETGRGRCSSWSWGSGWLGAAMETVWPHVHHDMQAQIYIHTKCSKTQKIKSVLCRVCRSLARTLGGGGSLVSLHFRGTAWPLRRTSSAGRSVFGYIALSFLYILCIDLVAFFPSVRKQFTRRHVLFGLSEEATGSRHGYLYWPAVGCLCLSLCQLPKNLPGGPASAPDSLWASLDRLQASVSICWRLERPFCLTLRCLTSLSRVWNSECPW